jgi:acid stress-induced BolA-like protein IbaG/YrbA
LKHLTIKRCFISLSTTHIGSNQRDLVLDITLKGYESYINIRSMDPNEIKNMIEEGLPGSIVNVEGDGTHFDALVIYSEFEGKGLLERHQIVYKALGEAMKQRIHALSLKTYTPEQWERIR